jgi:hypothetical protein
VANYQFETKSNVEIHDESRVFKGYTLYAPMYGYQTWLIDMNGDFVHKWEMKNPTSNHSVLTPEGTLFWHGRGDGALEDLQSNGTELIEVDWEGNEIWRYDDNYLNHDFELLENGNILLLRYCDIPEKIQKKIKGGTPGTEVNGKIYGISLHEINRDKEIVWEWYNYEHLDPEKDMECPLDPRMVWGYTNSVAAFPNGDPIISIRHMNTIARIDKKTGNIIWRWGPENLVGHQHCVTVLDNGNVMLFDNGLHRKYLKKGDPLEAGTAFEASRIIEVNPKTNKIEWEWIDPRHLIYSNICGSAQRLPNGNTLICESKKGIFYEITLDKKIVWKYQSPFVIKRPAYFGWSESKIVFQAHRYSEDFEGFKGKDLDPEKYELIVQKKSQETLKEEDKISKRLSMTGY